MSVRISELIDAGVLTGDELLELSRPSAAVTLTAATLSAEAADDSLNDSADGFVAAGFAAGDSVQVQGFTDPDNNVFSARIDTVTAGKMVLLGVTLADEAEGASITVTKWETRRVSVAQLLEGPSS